jgi:hypothetical protein
MFSAPKLAHNIIKENELESVTEKDSDFLSFEG